MPHRPADARIVHVHRGQESADGYAGLFPACAAIVRYQHVAARADHHQARAGGRAVEQQGFGRKPRVNGRLGARRSKGQQTEYEAGQEAQTQSSWDSGGRRNHLLPIRRNAEGVKPLEE